MNAEQVLRDMRVCFTEGECDNCPRIDDEDCVDGLCKDIIDLIESLQADNAELRKANSEYQDAQHPLFMALCDAQHRADAAVAILQTIDWVGSGAKGRIEDAIGILTGRGPSDGEVHHDA